MNFKQFRKILGIYYYRKKKRYQSCKIGNSTYNIVPKSIRDSPDLDDAWFYELCKYHKNIFDIGSNTGYFSLIAANLSHVEKVVLVDPNPEALAIAAENIIYNNLGIKAHFITAFISDSNGDDVKFYTVGTGAAGSMFSSHATSAAILNSFFFVKTLSLDEVSKKINILPDFIKLDVEGAEILALNGCNIIAKSQTCKILVEVHSNPELNISENFKNILHWCKNSGYLAFYLTDHSLIYSNEKIINRDKFHLLLLPEKMEYPDYLKTINEGDKIAW